MLEACHVFTRIRPLVWRLVAVALGVLAILPLSSLARPDQARSLVALPGVNAPHPQLVAPAAASFRQVRAAVAAQCGRDFLGKLDEAMRPVDYTTTKAGVAGRSWHKAGRAIDLKQSVAGVVVIRDVKNRMLRRVLLRCAKQNGTQGAWYGPKGLQNRGKPGYYLDVTTVLSQAGWNRIPPQNGTSEWWHYEYRRGARSWNEAMSQVYSVRTLNRYYPRSFK